MIEYKTVKFNNNIVVVNYAIFMFILLILSTMNKKIIMRLLFVISIGVMFYMTMKNKIKMDTYKTIKNLL
mgnify:CR=1 FL=1|jgi:hypothetical protein